MKWISYAVKGGEYDGIRKYDVIRGLLKDRHPLMLEWLHEKGVSPDKFLHVLVRELARGGNAKKILPVVAALEGCEPGLVRRIKDRRGSNLLWELLTVEKLPWNKERCGCSPGETIACMDKIAQELIRLGADPDARNKHLGFSWNDVISVAKAKFCQ